jgi:hypothetical protein
MTDKRELIKQYKQNPPEMGIFQIKNKINGKIFIGKAMNLNGIINSNRFQLKNKSHMNKVLQDDFNRQGEDNFTFEKLDILKARDDIHFNYAKDLELLEEMWLDKLQPFNEKGYNVKKAKR